MKKILIGVVLAGMFFSYVQADETDDAVGKAVAYLKIQESDATNTMALVAAGETVDVSYLKNFSGATAISYAKPILALTAAGKDPRTFPNEDFVVKMKTFADGTQLGDATQINDDVWGILALVSAGVSSDDATVQKSKSFILSNQNSDGGWAWNLGGTSDTNDTAAAIMALLEVGLAKSDTAIQNAISYLKNAQNDDGGFPYDPVSQVSPFGIASDANSDAWVIMAINKLGEDPKSWIKNNPPPGEAGKNPVDHLLSLQDDDGGFWWMPEGTEFNNKGATADAVIALSAKSYPVRKLSLPSADQSIEVSFRIEGSSARICKGKLKAKTAMDVVRNAAESCGYTPEIQDTSFGPYLSQIGSDKAQGLAGWLYRVNWQLASVGAADYRLQGGDEVLWYFGEFEWQPLRVEIIDKKDVYVVNDILSGRVSARDGETWKSAEGVEVLMNGISQTTSGDGKFEFALAETGMFELAAKKDKLVRADTVSIVVGDTGKAVNLSVEVVQEGSEVPGAKPEIAFSVTPTSLAYGKLMPGKTITKRVTIKNEGQKELRVGATVQGDEVFHFLKLDGKIWSTFEQVLGSDASKRIDATLSIPSEFSSFGPKQGRLIFLGTAQQ